MFNITNIISRIMRIGAVQRQSIISLITQIAYTFIGFLSTMYFAHAVGASVLGGYFLFVTYFSITNMVSNGGIGGAAIKRISESDEPNAYFTAFFVLRSMFLTVAVTTLFMFRDRFADFNEAGTFSWLLLALIVSLFSGAISNGIAGRSKMGIHAIGNFINTVLRILIQVIAVFLGYGATGLAGGFVSGMVIGAIVHLRFFDLHFARFGWMHIKSLSSFSFWLFLTSSGVMAYSYADVAMIGYFLGNADVGVYRVVMQFTSLATLATTALRSTLWPKISRWSKTNEWELIEKSLSRAITYALVPAVPIFAGGVLLGDRLLYFFYGAEFAAGYVAFVLLLIVQIVNVFQFFFITYLSALDQQKNAFKITAVAACANIMINLFLIPTIGIKGAAVATFITMAFNAVMARRVLSKSITIQLEYSSVLNILKASLLMVLFVGAYRMSIPLTSMWVTLVPVVLGGVMYGVLLLKFDRKMLEELKGIVMNVGL